MTENIPVVDFGLLGAECFVTEFIQVDNPVLRRIVNGFRAKTLDEAIAKAQEYVAKTLEYPLDFRGRPSASRQLKIFKWWNGFYLEEKNQDYGWLRPAEAVVTRKGICFDSACLLTTLLRMLQVEAYTVLGAVLATAKKQLLGFHAWTEAAQSNSQHVVTETTVHPKPATESLWIQCTLAS